MSDKIQNTETVEIGNKQLQKLLNQPAELLLLLWGWAQFLNFFRYYVVRTFMFSFATVKFVQYLTNGIVLLVFAFTVYYLWKHKKWHRQKVFKQLIAVWIVWFLSMVMTNLMLNNVLHTVVFELQHALFMLLTSAAILVTGMLIENKWLLWGGFLFAVLAFSASYFSLKYQMAFEAVGWLVALAIPGHLKFPFKRRVS
jgi:hypothetical protein